VYVHATAVGIFGLGLVFLLGYLASQRMRWPRVFRLGLGLFGLLLVQMALGELQYRTHLPWPLVLVHVGVAAAVWALLIGFVAVLSRPPAAFAQSPHVD
jgi:heme A synthase